MKKYFANYNQSIALKELGFDEPCFGVFYLNPENKTWEPFRTIEESNHNKSNFSISRPLIGQVFDWIRTKYKYYFWIEPCSQHKIFHFNITCSPSSFTYCTIDETKPNAGGFKSYEEAESACIDKLIEIVKNR